MMLIAIKYKYKPVMDKLYVLGFLLIPNTHNFCFAWYYCCWHWAVCTCMGSRSRLCSPFVRAPIACASARLYCGQLLCVYSVFCRNLLHTTTHTVCFRFVSVFAFHFQFREHSAFYCVCTKHINLSIWVLPFACLFVCSMIFGCA